MEQTLVKESTHLAAS